MWKKGTVKTIFGTFEFSAKVYEVGSPCGIKGGKISKLDIMKNGKIVAHYDRGWDKHPALFARSAYKKIVAAMN